MPDDVRMVDPLTAEVRALRAAVATLESRLARLEARQATQTPSEAVRALLDALEGFFGAGRFTVAGLLGIADSEPHGAIGCALADLIDLSASPRSRATALGALLSRLPDVEIVASQRGVSVYRLQVR